MKALRFLDKHLEEIILSVLIVIITFNTCLQCFMRYVLKSPLTWTDELSKYCLIYSGFFSIGYCGRRHVMIRVNIIESFISKRLYAILSTFVTLLMLIFYALLFRASIAVFMTMYESRSLSPALQIPMHYLYSGALAGFALGIVRCVQSLIFYDVPRSLGKGEKY